MTISTENSSVRANFANGVKALKRNNFLEAEAFFANCLSEQEDFHPAWLQLGITWAKMGRNTEASDAFRMAVSLNDKDVDSLYNLGLSLINSGHEDEGLSFMSKACELSDNPDIATSLAKVYYKTGNYTKSSFFFLKAYQKDKTSPNLIKDLAISLYQEGDTTRAVILMRDLLLRFPNNEQYRSITAEIMNKWALPEFDIATKKVIELCFQQDVIRHRNLAPAWCATFLTDPDFEILRQFPTADLEKYDFSALFSRLKAPFLCLGLRRIITGHAIIEHIFTHIRHYFMTHWENSAAWPRSVLEFLSALAIQCWYNDFIFFETPEEKEQLAALRTHINTLLKSGQKIDEDTAKLLALACCYTPLYEIYNGPAPLPLTSGCRKIMAPLVKAQFDNPHYEASLIPSIKSFTEIEDATSKAVQTMYESRPYPRWTSVNASKTSDALRNISANLEILVAGCGTGQEPCLYASVLPEAHITAIDLSRTSIAYAMRMAEELGFADRITFLHGDLMKVGELNKEFDYVVSSGVLHHLKEPEKGLAAILSTLKSGGKMSLSLYSKIARDKILNPASAYITEKGYTSSLDDIRQFRKDIFGFTSDDPRTLCTHAGDFFNLSECNDLLFHVQEHRYTFPLIKDMADRHGLEAFYVNLSPHRKKAFTDMFPNGDVSDLELMAEFETKNPEAFAEMYKVYFRRKGDTSPHPLDQLIRLGAI